MRPMRHKTKSHQGKSSDNRASGGNWDPSSPAMVQAMGVAAAHHRQGNLAAAEQACDEILVRNPKHPDALTLLAMICHQTDRNDRAVKLCTDVLRRDKKQPGTWFVLAGAEIAKGRAKEAKRAVAALLKLQPGHPAAAQLQAKVDGL